MPPINTNGAVAVGPGARPELHPDVQPLAQHLLRAGMLAIEKAVAHIDAPAEFPVPAGSLEANLAQRLVQMPPARRAAAIQRVMPLVKADAAARATRYGALAKVNLRAGASVEAQAQPLAPKLVVSAGSVVVPDASGPDGLTQQGIKLPPPFTQLRLRLRAVKCVDETDGFLGSESGDDEISLGTIRIAPTGKTTNQGIIGIGSEFDDGEVVSFSPPKVLATWNLPIAPQPLLVDGNGNPLVVEGQHVPVGWPRTCALMFTLAETDEGGFPADLATICDLVRDWVVKKITTAAAAAVGEFFGGALGAAIGAAVGKLVGDLVDWILGGVIDFLIQIWEDDVFPVVTARTSRPHPWQLFSNGQTISSPKMLWAQAHGGKYEIHYDWQLVK